MTMLDLPMPVPRPAVPGDADELARLHVEAGLGQELDEAWRATYRDDLLLRLKDADPGLLAFVIDAPGTGGLASAAVGFVHATVCRPGSPAGVTAHLDSVTTLVPFRRRGYATAVTTAFLNNAAQRGCHGVTLTATDAGVGLYRRLGFIPHTRAMRRGLTPRTPPAGPPALTLAPADTTTLGSADLEETTMTHLGYDAKNPPPVRASGLGLIVKRSADTSQVLVVRPTYKDDGYYQLPGGGAHEDEPDWQATVREVKRETGLDVAPGRLLVKDWMAKNPRTGNAAGYNFVRFCGYFPEDFPTGTDITLPTAAEGERPDLDAYLWLDLDDLDVYCAPYQARRIRAAVTALLEGTFIELERGEPVLQDAA